jgi:WD40 repeat protein
VREPGLPGLCPQCLLSLALLKSPKPVDADAEPASDPGEVATLDRPAPGRVLGERYQIREVLGRGGMGEVFRAFDLKLRVDVALKAVREGRVEGERGREMLRHEVRTAREVVSANVCRIFDLVEEGGEELVSMEYVDGKTLAETLRRRGPLVLKEAREIALQFLSGLEAIHEAGLVHRDFKPENVMLTRAGRVVVMDFGLAKSRSEGGTGTIAGTPGYMSPEQARGEKVDARADVYAAGVVLAEMLSVGGEGIAEARQALWRAVREVPPRVAEGPWAGAIRQALSADPEERPGSARALARALEEVTQRLPGFETKRPYPGLMSFTEEDAEYFFGRELEVEGLLKKLRRPRLLALVAPSGAGKTSFLRAGLLPTLPKGWKALYATPGSRPFQALAQALAPTFAGDAQAVQALLRFEEEDTAVSLFQRFRQRHEQALVVVDQFEELFTLNPPQVQQSFAKLLGRLVLDADLHVILSLRDDFIYRCHGQESLKPGTSDLTILGTLGESGLRRALVQPALSCGYRFEDDALVDEMVGEVVKERGALPLLAFAASRLWEKRDREKGLLTREAYREIGGVAGSLAQHAEATLERIGTQCVPLVRELFRNLVTSQGTRAVRERDELLSVFGGSTVAAAGEAERAKARTGPKPRLASAETPSSHEIEPKTVWSRKDAEEVLDALVDARLLTTYERAGEGGESHQQVEIVHESLLAAWPRLVRWQTQDADGAQLRDQLRQAAQLWQDRGQPEDLLWSGTAYRDFALWRERYPGGLTAMEEAFAQAAARRAGRRRRRRRMAVAAIVSALSVGLGVLAVFWSRAETARARAEAETLRAEASKLVTLGDEELTTYPTGGLAYAIKSLELADTMPARLLALRVLQHAPVARIAPMAMGDPPQPLAASLAFSPNGEWVATGGATKSVVLHRSGERHVILTDYPSVGLHFEVAFTPGSDALVADQEGDVRVWSIPDGRVLRRGRIDEGRSFRNKGGESALVMRDDGFLTFTTVGEKDVIRWWPLGKGEPRLIGTMEPAGTIAVARATLAYGRGRKLWLRSLDRWSAPPRLLAEQPAKIWYVALSPDGGSLAASDFSSDVIRVWATRLGSHEPRLALDGKNTPGLRFDPAGRWLAAGGRVSGSPTIRLFDLEAPSGASPLVLQRGDTWFMNDVRFDPEGGWLATAHTNDVAFWWLGGSRPRILAGMRSVRGVRTLEFTPDGESLLSGWADGTLRAWPLTGGNDTRPRILLHVDLGMVDGIFIDWHRRNVVFSALRGRVRLIPLDGGPAKDLLGFSSHVKIGPIAFGDEGRLVAAAPTSGPREEKVIRVWNLDTGAVQVLGPVPGAGDGLVGGMSRRGLAFVGPDRILACVGGTGLVSFDLKTGTASPLAPQPTVQMWLNHAGNAGVGMTATDIEDESSYQLIRFRLDGSRPVPLRSYGLADEFFPAAFDPSDRLLATGSADGTIRVGPADGDAPYLLLGHKGLIQSLAFSPDGHWLASSADDGTIRLWPVPEVTKPPMHTLPLDVLLAKLRTHTNLRAVADPASPNGYKLEPGPFPGWTTPPEW